MIDLINLALKLKSRISGYSQLYDAKKLKNIFKVQNKIVHSN